MKHNHCACAAMPSAGMYLKAASTRSLLLASMFGLTPSICTPVHATESHVQITHEYNIAAGTLETALNQLGQQSAILLSYSPTLTHGLTSQGLHGHFTLEQASTQLLAGTGLSLNTSADGNYQLTQTSDLMPLTVTGNTIKTGSIEDGYRVSNVKDLGPIQDKALLDTPYSISILPSTLFENVNAGKPSDAQRISPFIQLGTSQDTAFTNSVNLRGFSGSGWNQKFEDGLRASSLAMTPLEDKERMEVLTGLSGFLYGMANPGGVLNFVQKRPTEHPLANLTAGSYGAESYFSHADLSNALNDDGTLTYRLNLVVENGDTAVDDQSRERYLISSAFDYHANEDLLFQFNASHSDVRTEGTTPFWYFVGGQHPAAPDSAKQWGQDWSFGETDTTKARGKVNWQLSNTLSVRAALSHSQTRRKYLLAGNFFVADNTFAPGLLAVSPQKHNNTAAYVFADTKMTLGNSVHTVTAGVTSDRYKTREHKDNSTRQYLSGLNTFGPDPIHVPAVAFASLPIGKEEVRVSARANNRSLILADSIEFNDQWSSIIGVTHTNITQTDYDFSNTGAVLSDYDKSATSPSISLNYKPRPWISTYLTYMEGLEQGGAAPIGSANFGELLSPVDSKQYEIGTKAELDDLLLTAALFDVERTNEFLDSRDNVFKQEGYQHNQGIELSATGKLTDQLTVISGITLLDAQASASGKDPVGVSEKLIKLYAEYDMGPIVEGLTLTGGAFFTGARAVDTDNTEYLPSYTLLDAGLRYEVKSMSTPLTLTLNIKNLGNKHYWSTANYLGEPRSISFAAKLQF